MINCSFIIFRSSASSFSFPCLMSIKFLKSSRSCVLLPIPFTPVICLAPNILFCFSNHQGAVFFFLLFFLCHLSNCVMKKAMFYQNMTNLIDLSMQGIIWKRPLLSYTFFVFYLPYLLQFRKSRSCVLLPIPFTPVICFAPNIFFCFSNHQGAVLFFLLSEGYRYQLIKGN